MSPDPRWQLAVHSTGPKRRTSTLEKDVIERVRTTDGFWNALRALSTSSGIAEDKLQGFAEDLCTVAYAQADEVASGEGPLKKARDEVDQLKQKLHRCNLSAMKQIAAVKAGAHAHGSFGDDTIMFHEPLQYLDQETKELVYSVVCEKVRLLEVCNAPQSLVEALEQHASAAAKGKAGSGPADEELAEELETAKLELKEVRSQLKTAQSCAEDAVAESERLKVESERLKSQTETLRQQTEALKFSLAEAERTAQTLRDELSGAREALSRAVKRAEDAEVRVAEVEAEAKKSRQALEELQLEHQRLQVEHEDLQQLSAQQQAEISRIGQELQRERSANGQLRAEVERLQAQLRESQQQLQELQKRFSALEEEARCMREELSRRNRTTTHGTQTTLTGTKLDDQAADTKKTKLMLEELQMKMKEMIDKIKRKGMGKEIAQITEELGLQDLVKAQSVFERLYDDAMYRVSRLERLREKIRKDRQELQPTVPEAAEVSVEDAVGQSDLPGFKGFLQETHPGPSGKAPHGQETASSRQQRSMRASSSLPSLTSGQQAASVVTLGYGAHGTADLRRTRRQFF